MTPAEVQDWVRQRQRQVLTFLGYSAAEYEHHAAMLAQAATVLTQHDPAATLVNIGATADGIGAVYALARQQGFETMGIVSRVALRDGARWSDAVDHVFVIDDDTWGGALPGGGLSPTSAAMVAVSQEMVAIGGGAITRDELLAGRAAGKPVRFIPADMHHRTAQDKARRAGLPEPTSYAGALGTEPWAHP